MRDSETVSKLRGFFQGNEDAVALALMLTHACDVWDDLIDRDRLPSEAEINKAFMFLMCAMPRNPFYREHIDELLPVIDVGVMNWMAANEFERSGERKALEIAHVIRHSIGDVFIHMARLIGGLQWGVEVAPKIKLLVNVDSLEEYLKE